MLLLATNAQTMVSIKALTLAAMVLRLDLWCLGDATGKGSQSCFAPFEVLSQGIIASTTTSAAIAKVLALTSTKPDLGPHLPTLRTPHPLPGQ